MKKLKTVYRYIEDFIDNTVFRGRWQPMYWLRCHTFNRYHIINISGQGDYNWGWTDSDFKMEAACYKILVDFVEKEYPGHIDWDHEARIRKIRDEILAIYKWWSKGKKQEEDDCNRLFDESGWNWHFTETDETKDLPKHQKLYSMNTETKDPAKYEEYEKARDALEAKREKMFLRLIKVRKHMWT